AFVTLVLRKHTSDPGATSRVPRRGLERFERHMSKVTHAVLRGRALDSGGSHGGIQHLPPRDPPESNALAVSCPWRGNASLRIARIAGRPRERGRRPTEKATESAASSPARPAG